MDTETTVVSGKEISKGWTDEQNDVIARYQETLGITRPSAMQKLRRLEDKGVTATQQLAALKNETPVPGNSQPVENSKQEATPVRTKKAAKAKAPKKEARKTLSDYKHGKAERMAESKRTGVPEMELCAKYSRQYDLPVPPCVLRWEKKREQREAKAAAKAKKDTK